jgi:SIR2-like domain
LHSDATAGSSSISGPTGASTVVEIPNAYTDVSSERTVLFKIHGGVDARPEREWESFVVSEDDYIDYLAQADISVVLPVTLAARLRRSHFLFLWSGTPDSAIARAWLRGLRAANAWGVASGVPQTSRTIARRRQTLFGAPQCLTNSGEVGSSSVWV